MADDIFSMIWATIFSLRSFVFGGVDLSAGGRGGGGGGGSGGGGSVARGGAIKADDIRGSLARDSYAWGGVIKDSAVGGGIASGGAVALWDKTRSL